MAVAGTPLPAAAPTQTYHAATKGYVDTGLALKADRTDVETAASVPLLRHRFTGDTDGIITGRAVHQVRTGASITWQTTGTASTYITSGTAGYQTGQSGNVASYFHVGVLASFIASVGARMVFPASDLVAASGALGLFTDLTFGGGTNNSPAHLAVTPTYLEFSVFSGGVGNFTPLVPVGELTSKQEYANALTCDGTTEYPVQILIDQAHSRAWVHGPDGRVLRYEHPWIGSISGTIPFWEPFGDPSTGPVARYAEVWAYDTLPTVPDVPVSALQVSHARSSAFSGAGTATARPASRAVAAGSAWWDADQAKLTVADGAGWRDTAGTQVGNLLTRNAALALTDVSGLQAVSCSRVRIASVRPTGRGSCYKVTVTTAGTIALYVANLSLGKFYTGATAGQPYSSGIAAIAAASGTARTCHVEQGFYNDSNTAVGSAVAASTASCGTSGAFVALPQVTGTVAPAGSTQTTMLVYIAGTTLGEVFYLSGLYITPGSVAGYQEP